MAVAAPHLTAQQIAPSRALPSRFRDPQPKLKRLNPAHSTLGVEEQRVNVIAEFCDRAPLLRDGYRVEG